MEVKAAVVINTVKFQDVRDPTDEVSTKQSRVITGSEQRIDMEPIDSAKYESNKAIIGDNQSMVVNNEGETELIGTTTTNNEDPMSKSQIRREINSLHEELELAQHGISKSGQFQRKIPRPQSKVRNQKRKKLELAEEMKIERLEIKNNLNIISTKNNEKRQRLRGSKAALVDERIMNDNLLTDDKDRNDFLRKKDTSDSSDEDNEPNDSVRVEDANFDAETDFEDAGDFDANDESDQDDEAGSEDSDVEDSNVKDNGNLNKLIPPTPVENNQSHGGRKISKKNKSNRRYQNRLRNFKSQRLAEKHGAALGAHALGRPLEAIQQLKQVAREAASAPQVYSSLGLVYDDMLKQSQNARNMLIDGKNSEQLYQGGQRRIEGNRVAKWGSNNSRTKSKRKSRDVNIPDDNLSEQLDLAKKAYGAYHVAAILYRRDYNLWLRAADSATEIASIHASIMRVLYIPDSVREYHRVERRRWLEEAKNDYTTADNLHPPGIDIPAKLAYVQMELGMYADALTLLTDLKNFPDFRSSYKAWLLYSDLMLRIGYECLQWNKGSSTVTNYMFRRWLRKLSTTFDWKERRLQALSKAFEAACGSKVCCQFVQWLQNRTNRKINDNLDNEDVNGNRRWHTSDLVGTDQEVVGLEDSLDRMDTSMNENSHDNNEDTEEKMDISEKTNYNTNTLETEEKLLNMRIKDELASFDATTKELNLASNSVVASVRNASRQQLIKQHEASRQHLKNEFNEKTFEGEVNSPDSRADEKESIKNIMLLDKDNIATHTSENWDEMMLMSASCETVFSIASELLRQIVLMNLLQEDEGFGNGGRLVCEAVSEYLKQRHQLCQRRVKERTNCYANSDESGMNANGTNGEKLSSDQTSSDMLELEDEILISDDDELISSKNPEFLLSLERGILPPDLLVLYGLCLMVKGGKDYLAAQCISQIEQLPIEGRAFWNVETLTIDTSINADSTWIFYRQSLTEPLGRTAFLALVADVIYKSGREKEFSKRVAVLYRSHLTTLSESNVVREVLTWKKGKNGSVIHRHNVLFRVLVAAARFEVHTIEDMLSEADDKADERNCTTLLKVMQSLSELFRFIWKSDKYARISSFSIETMDSLSRAFSLIPGFSERILKNNHKDFLVHAVEMMTQSVALVSNVSDTTGNVEKEVTVDGLASFPFQSSWMTTELTRFAVRTFNLCVATNVSLFSGWEIEEFSVRLMRHGNVPNFIGVSMSEAKVTGCLSVECEVSLSRQWNLAKSILPSHLSFDFDSQLAIVHNSVEYKEANERLDKARSNHSISCYGEDKGLSLLLSFSHSCLIQAIATPDQSIANRLLLIALSIVIPASEFCLGVVIWDSAIGSSATSSQTNFDEWRNFDWEKDNVAPSNRQGYVRPRQRTIVPDDSRSLHEWFLKEEEHAPLSNLISLPSVFLQQEWAKEFDDTVESDGVEFMDKLDTKVKQLRSCYSEAAVEKASLHVAETLLDVAASKNCHNRFLTIQLAALFASQGQKGGTSDLVFKRRLPSKEKCTTLDALITIGRADCLHSIQFLPESAFLCSYVASVCSFHRDRLQEEYKWNSRWRIISILAYNLSVVIRNAANQLGLDQERREETCGIWDKEVIDELIRSRSDGISWKAKLGLKPSQFPEALVTKARISRKITSFGHYRKLRAHEDADVTQPPTSSSLETEYCNEGDVQESTPIAVEPLASNFDEEIAVVEV